MSVQVFIVGLFILGPLFALALVLYANRLDRRAGYVADAPTSMYVPGAAVSVVLLLVLAQAYLSADVPIGDNCKLLEPYSWEWWLLGCYWGSGS